jgi:N-methylhydantoinase B/oxoprolinase/acetone carboxylase alpha subunit
MEERYIRRLESMKDEPDMWIADLEFRISRLVLAAWNVGEAFGRQEEGTVLQALRDNLAAATESLREHVRPVRNPNRPPGL